MGVLDFLFEGKPPASVTTYGQSVQNVPSWLSDYTQGLIARANMVAAEPYQAYQGPRVAGFNQTQTDAQNKVKQNVGSWSPLTNAAQSGYQGVLDGPGGLSQASPYLQSGTESYTDNVDKYMNPYVQNVIDRSTQVANRNLTEKIMPAIKGNFIKSGAYGSAGQQRAVGQSLRDVTEGVQSQANAALSQAYQSGAALHGDEATRNLQAGQTAGSLYGQDMSQRLSASQGMGGLGQMIQQMQGMDASSLAAVGADQQGLTQRNYDTAYGDFQAQRGYPKEQVGWMSGIINGLPNQGGTTTTQNNGPANVYQPSLASQLASMYGIYKGLTEKSRGGLARYARGGSVKRIKGPPVEGGLATYRRISNGR
jgi:hypothetical protein